MNFELVHVWFTVLVLSTAFSFSLYFHLMLSYRPWSVAVASSICWTSCLFVLKRGGKGFSSSLRWCGCWTSLQSTCNWGTFPIRSVGPVPLRSCDDHMTGNYMYMYTLISVATDFSLYTIKNLLQSSCIENSVTQQIIRSSLCVILYAFVLVEAWWFYLWWWT